MLGSFLRRLVGVPVHGSRPTETPAPAAANLERDAEARLRHDRLHGLYARCIELLLHESRLVLDRTTAFVSSNAILFAAFFLLGTRADRTCWATGFMLGISALGTSLSVVQPLLIVRTVDALDFWRSTLALLEEDADFWYPGRGPADADLDLTRARARYWAGTPTRQAAAPLRLSRVAERFPGRFLKRAIIDPNTFFAIWLPLAIGALWLIALAWSAYVLVDLVAA